MAFKTTVLLTAQPSLRIGFRGELCMNRPAAGLRAVECHRQCAQQPARAARLESIGFWDSSEDARETHSVARCQGQWIYFFSIARQLTTTVMGEGAWSKAMLTRNRWPSRLGT